jgi:hypothetical protein
MDNQHPPKLGKCEACYKEYEIETWNENWGHIDHGYRPTPNCPYCGYSQMLEPVINGMLSEYVEVAMDCTAKHVGMMCDKEYSVTFEINSDLLVEGVIDILKNRCPQFIAPLEKTQNRVDSLKQNIKRSIDRGCRIIFPIGRIDTERLAFHILREVKRYY